MEDNSIILNFANDEDFELMILKDLHQIIEMIADRYPHHVDFRFVGQEGLKMDEKELKYYENLYGFIEDMFTDYFKNKDKQNYGFDELRGKWINELVNRNMDEVQIKPIVESGISLLSNIESIYDFEEDMKVRNYFIAEMNKGINKFCDGNGFTKLLRRKLIYLLNLNPVMTGMVLFECSERLLRTSDAIGITNRYKSFYEKLTGIIPCEEEFIQYLKFRTDVYLDAESMKVYLSEYMDNEVSKTYNLPKNKKYKQQTLIDITPQQTLSVVNQKILDNVGDMQISEPLKLRSKTGTFISGYNNDWHNEEASMAFHYFLKNINKPLTIKHIQANLFPRYSEFVIIRLLDDLVERLEIEYTKEKIDNEDVYKIEPLEMYLWETTNTHFLSEKMRREVIMEIVERVRTNVYDGHYQKVKKEIESDVLVNFHNPIEEIKERIQTVRNKLNRRITFYYKVDDIDKFVEMIQNRHLDKHFINDKTEDVEIIEWELNKMFKLQSWIDCGNNKLRELLSVSPTTSATVESKNLVLSHQTISIGIETTLANVEESKEVEIIIKDEVNGTPCIEFDNLFGADIRRKNEVWQYMKLLGMIDSEGKYLLGGERAIIRAFVMVMKKNGKFTPTAEEGFLIRVVGLKLLGDNNVRVRPSKQIQAKQNEIVIFLNNQETKNSSFINVG